VEVVVVVVVAAAAAVVSSIDRNTKLVDTETLYIAVNNIM